MRRIALIAFTLAFCVPPLAEARDKAEGWRNWTERATRISDAIYTGDSPGLDSACKGVTGTVVSQGFQFPYWAQSLIQVCTVAQAGYHGSGHNRRSKQICNDLKDVSRKIGKSEPVAEGPGAHEIAQRISKQLLAVRDQLCVNFR
jgi:hypothetical protein